MLPAYYENLVDVEFQSCLRSYDYLPDATGLVLATDFPSIFKSIPCPILALCAENEFLRPWFQDALDARPDAQHKIMGPVKYFVPELDTETVVETVTAFIEEVEKTSQ